MGKAFKIALIILIALFLGVLLMLPFIVLVGTRENTGMFENITSSLFNKYNVSEGMSQMYWKEIWEPVKGMIYATLVILVIVLVICAAILLLVER